MKLFSLKKIKAQRLNSEGQALSDAGRNDEAIEAYLKAIELNPSKSECFYNIGLIYKYQGEWLKSFEYNSKAFELDSEDEAVRWNLAIAATALRNWEVARSVWKDNGIVLDGQTGPINMDYGITPVRLNSDDSGEVVWGTRLDPVRVRIDSVPYKESGFKHGDVVLHDGAPVGHRNVGDNEYPVFNVLEMFEPSSCSTAVATVTISNDTDLKILDQLFSEGPHEMEDWTTNVRNLCRQCSEGKIHVQHDEDLAHEWSSERTLGIAIYRNTAVVDIFKIWERKCEGKLLELKL